MRKPRKRIKVRLRSEVRRKRLRAIGLAAAALTTAALGIMGFMAARNGITDYLGSARFAVKEISVEGLRGVDEKIIMPQLEPLRKSTVWNADYKGVAKRIMEKHPRVKKVSFRKRPPAAVIVKITEREAEAVIKKNGRLDAVDKHMALFAPTDEDRAGLPEILEPPDEAAPGIVAFLDALGDVDAAFKKRVKSVSVDSVSMHLTLDDDTAVLWGATPEKPSSKNALKAISAKIARINLIMADAKKRFGGCLYIDLTQSPETLERVVVMPQGKKI